jgi:hypothetical protein
MQNRGGGPKKVAIGATQESDKKRICTSPQPSSIQARQRGRATQRPKRQSQRPGRKGSREGKKWQRQEEKLLATTSSQTTLENDMLVQLEKLRGRAEEERKPHKREGQKGASMVQQHAHSGRRCNRPHLHAPQPIHLKRDLTARSGKKICKSRWVDFGLPFGHDKEVFTFVVLVM